nr:TIGR03862 family flavoprotein [Nitrospira moscoviensis]
MGGGPAGLMAAEAAVEGGAQVDLYDAMASVGRKFLLAGKGGLNLTHSEPLEPFLARYGDRRPQLAPFLAGFAPEALRQWARGLGAETFVGTSGRVFPADMKSAPLLRAWLRRLRRTGLRLHVRHRWTGWHDEGLLRFETPDGPQSIDADAVILALGGASWPRLGSDAAWVPILAGRGVPIAPLLPANCGFDVRWTDHFRMKFAGQPVKSVGVIVKTVSGEVLRRRGEFVVTEHGLEGGVIYAVSAHLRDAVMSTGCATIWLDLSPDRDVTRLIADLSQPRGKRTLATHLERRAGIAGVKAGLLREAVPKEAFLHPEQLAAAIKSLPISVVSPRPVDEAISTAGGISFAALDDRLMIRALPGVFCAGEMLDWEAPTGGYLLTACFATGRAAGAGAVAWLKEQAKGRAVRR